LFDVKGDFAALTIFSAIFSFLMIISCRIEGMIKNKKIDKDKITKYLIGRILFIKVF